MNQSNKGVATMVMDTAKRPAGWGDELARIEAEIAEAQQRLAMLRRRHAARLNAAASAGPIDLYDWQRDALVAWDDAGRRGVVQAVTGAGKTRVGLAAIQDAIGSGRQAAVIVPTLSLVRQWTAQIAELLPAARLKTRVNSNQPWDVVVTTVQSAMRRPMLTRRGGLVVADECHRYGAESYALALNSGYEWRLGLTATLERGDDGDEILRSYFRGVCFDLGYERATADELIAPFKLAFASVPLSGPERAEYDQLDADLRSARLPLVQRYGVPESPVAEFLKGVSALAEDRTPGSGGGLARRYMSMFSRRKALLAETRMKYLVLHGLVTAVLASAGSIVFTQTQAAAGSAASVLAEAGCSAAAVHSDLDADEREQRLQMLKTGQITALAAPRILDEGVDVPDADLGIVMASNRSRRQMVQRLGRVLRRREGKVARFVVLYAEGSVEDPFAQDRLPDFYEHCLPWAAEHARFDLGAGELPQLLEFLGVTTDATARHAMRELVHAVTPVVDGKGEAPPGAKQARAKKEKPAGGRRRRPDAPGRERFLVAPLGAFGPVSEDAVSDYLLAIGRYPLLTADEETHLARAIEAGLYAEQLLIEERMQPSVAELILVKETGALAKQWLVVSNLRLVVSIAKRYAGRGLAFLDLIQAGNEGLIHAVEKFDHQQGTKFSTYGTWWITQAVNRALANEGSTIRLPVHFVDKLKQVDNLRRRTGQSWAELLRDHPDGLGEFEAGRGDLVRMARLARPIVSTEWLSEQVDDSWVGVSVARTDPTLEDEVTDALASDAFVQDIFAHLEVHLPVGLFVLRCRFGFQTGEPETLDVIGRRRGVTRERIRQIERKALDVLQEYVGVRQPPADSGRPARSRGAAVAPPASGTPRRAEASVAPARRLPRRAQGWLDAQGRRVAYVPRRLAAAPSPSPSPARDVRLGAQPARAIPRAPATPSDLSRFAAAPRERIS